MYSEYHLLLSWQSLVNGQRGVWRKYFGASQTKMRICVLRGERTMKAAYPTSRKISGNSYCLVDILYHLLLKLATLFRGLCLAFR